MLSGVSHFIVFFLTLENNINPESFLCCLNEFSVETASLGRDISKSFKKKKASRLRSKIKVRLKEHTLCIGTSFELVIN